jgi:hypothetical protein
VDGSKGLPRCHHIKVCKQAICPPHPYHNVWYTTHGCEERRARAVRGAAAGAGPRRSRSEEEEEEEEEEEDAEEEEEEAERESHSHGRYTVGNHCCVKNAQSSSAQVMALIGAPSLSSFISGAAHSVQCRE